MKLNPNPYFSKNYQNPYTEPDFEWEEDEEVERKRDYERILQALEDEMRLQQKRFKHFRNVQ
jgi:hypothetical protein